MSPELLNTFHLTVQEQARIDRCNAERLAAYQKKLRVWRDAHPEDYWVRLRKGLAVRWTWQRLWERTDRAARQTAAPVLRLVSTHPGAGA